MFGMTAKNSKIKLSEINCISSERYCVKESVAVTPVFDFDERFDDLTCTATVTEWKFEYNDGDVETVTKIEAVTE